MCLPGDGEHQGWKGIEYLLDPVDRFPLPKDGGDSEDPLNLLHAAARSSMAEQEPADAADTVAEAQSSVSMIRARDEVSDGIEVDSKRPRKSLPASQGSAIKADAQAPGWTKRLVCKICTKWLLRCPVRAA